MVIEEEDDSDLKVVSNYQPRIASAATASSSSSSSSSSSTSIAGKGLTMVDPVSGKAIPIHQMEEHMRIQLLDPQWKEQQRRFQEKQKDTGYAEGASIADSLKTFAKKRGDIFGQAVVGGSNGSAAAVYAEGESAASIAEEAAAERQRQEERSYLQWDGYTGSIATMQKISSALPDTPYEHHTGTLSAYPHIGPSATMPTMPTMPGMPMPPSMIPPPPPTAGMYGMIPPPPPPSTVPTAAAAMYGIPPPPPPLSSSMGIPPPPPPMMMMNGGGIPPAPPAPVPVPVPMMSMNYFATASVDEGDENKAKKPRTEAVLIPAEEFAASFKEPIDIHIQLPLETTMSHWNLNGQSVKLSVPVMLTVKEIKEAVAAQHLANMPPGKFQLKHAIHGFLKDANSLAGMNLGSNTTLELTIKSRGGKR